MFVTNNFFSCEQPVKAAHKIFYKQHHIINEKRNKHVQRTCLMYHAACKVEFQPFNRSYSKLTFFNFSLKKLKNVSCEYDRWVVETQLCMLPDTQTRSMGALVLCSIRNMMYGTQFHKFLGRPFARVLYAFFGRSVTALGATRVNRTILQGRCCP